MHKSPESSSGKPVLTRQDLDSFQKVLNEFQKNDDDGTYIALMNGEITPRVNAERARIQQFEDLRVENDELRRQLAEAESKEKEPPLYTRRGLIIRSLATAATIPLAINLARGLGAVKDDMLEETPEEKVLREKDEKKRALQSLEYKREHLMSTQPSTPSHSGWTVRHPEASDAVTYHPLLGTNNLITRGEGRFIQLPLNNDPDTDFASIYMKVGTFDEPVSSKRYLRIDVQLTAYSEGYSGRGASPDIFEEFVIDPKLADEAVDPNVLEFRNIETDQRIYASISRAKTDDAIYNIQILEQQTQ